MTRLRVSPFSDLGRTFLRLLAVIALANLFVVLGFFPEPCREARACSSDWRPTQNASSG